MIDLNMLKSHPVIHGVNSEKDGAKLLVVVIVSVFIGALLTVGILRVISGISNSEEEFTQGFTNVEVKVVNESSVIKTGELKDSVKGTYVPDVNFTSYSDMSMMERMNYEHAYSYYLFRELSLIIPPDVDFNSLSVSEFENVQALGGVKTKAGVGNLFSSLKKGRGWDLKPKPASLIRSLGGDEGFQFRFEGMYQVTLSALDASAITEKNIPAVEHLQRLKDSVMTVVKRAPVVPVSSLSLLDTQFEGKYRHYFYTIEGKSNFAQFNELLREMRSLKLPISISDVKLSASQSGLHWRVTVKITVV